MLCNPRRSHTSTVQPLLCGILACTGICHDEGTVIPMTILLP